MIVDTTGNQARSAKLLKHIHAESPIYSVDGNGIREVGTTFFFKNSAISIVEHRDEQANHFFDVDWPTIERFEIAFRSDHGGRTDFQVQVAGLDFDGGSKKFVDFKVFFFLKQTLRDFVSGRGSCVAYGLFCFMHD
jgi:hypothetical protein